MPKYLMEDRLPRPRPAIRQRKPCRYWVLLNYLSCFEKLTATAVKNELSLGIRNTVHTPGWGLNRDPIRVTPNSLNLLFLGS